MDKIIFVSPVNFEALKQRHQGLALELAKNNYEIFFVNPLCSNGFSCKTQKKAKNLTILDLKIPFKAASYPIIQNISIKIALKLIIKILHIKTSDCILWLAEPSYAEMTNTNWRKIIYDCCDLHGSFPKQKYETWQSYESKIAADSDLITISHPFIKEHFNQNNQKKCLLIPNATSFNSYKNEQNKDYNSKIKILSSGAHYEWIDIDWLKMLSDIENSELHIAGKGRGKAFNQLLKNKNVVFHGELNKNQLLQLMLECNVGVIPFKNLELIKGVDPIKAYDYKAARLEVWAPDIESLYSNKYIDSFIKDAEQTKEAIEKLKNIGFNKQTEQVPTWSERVKIVLPHL